ncbi:hypothetical protein PCIT_a3310 [Pseudoalteromonas citrea]|uniref:Macrodomain Ori protein n=2 Tax=Pseudoalteromonas citrea TaxID=43655 RepID=A0AAD4FR12_9GAMM|nr:DUF413 domain-containing protein [Pseudoalteromonas citrea]KAF7768809.1 hypothetical protein PCIT_a3310 [Pseudoalteromonas citrea]
MNQNLTSLRNAFASPHPFYDDVNFSQGFSRCGHFTLLEADILEHHGAILKSLQTKKTPPKNSHQSHFVKAMEGTCSSENVIEKTWAKYLKFSTCKSKIYTITGNSKAYPDNDVHTDMDIDL